MLAMYKGLIIPIFRLHYVERSVFSPSLKYLGKNFCELIQFFFNEYWSLSRENSGLQGAMLVFLICITMYPTWLRGNFGLKLQNSSKLPRIHARFHCNANEQG